jgi:putative membrane-bound dehydrogenase-like protein
LEATLRSLNLLPCIVLLTFVCSPAFADTGVVPTDASGRPLNLGFEDGTLKDWTATGDAFAGQPVKGDSVTARHRAGMRSNHAGDYWVGTYEIAKSDEGKGTLTSATFKVTQPWGSFLVGGGADIGTERVEIVRAGDQSVIFRATGADMEDMRRVAVDLTKEQGKEIFIRIVDDASGAWGHINFDDFRFHAQKPAVAAPARSTELLVADVVKNAGLSPQQAVEAMAMPPGFSAQLVAGEPDVQQPVALAIDDRGRLWVAEAYTYPVKAPEGKGQDKILIFEDTKHDGHFDKRTVFIEGLNLVSGLEVGFGGVWVGQAPNLLFIPILDGDKPGKPEVMLDGWGHQDTHETINSLSWGPDGWLYGCQGVFTNSNVGKPGAPDSERTPLNACVWRFHPKNHTFEVFAEGGSNQWGIDWNDRGQMFMTACVIPHLYHVIQGGRYVRQAGPHTDPYTFDDIKTIADHVHWVGGNGPHAGNGKSDSAGGGHAHCGAMIYLGDNWPAQYRDQIFMGNIHGNRMNQDLLEQTGSGFIGHHGTDQLLMNDQWARLINEKYGPDGGVFVIDWYDKQACHLTTPEVWDRSNGRIYKITYDVAKPVNVDLQKLSEADLIKLMEHPNEWYARHARRILQERGLTDAGVKSLTETILGSGSETVRLRAMWTLASAGPWMADESALLKDASPYIRGWAIQFGTAARLAQHEIRGNARAARNAVLSRWIDQLESMAKQDDSPIVRLYLASAAGRLSDSMRWPIVEALAVHSEDSSDHNLPLMYWYAAEASVPADVNRAAALAVSAKIPVVREFIARRLAMMSGSPEAMAAAVDAVGKAGEPAAQVDLLNGIITGLTGQRSFPMPAGWAAVYDALGKSASADVRRRGDELATIFGDPKALSKLRSILADAKAEPDTRQGAMDSLLAAKDAELPPILQSLLGDHLLRGAAIRGLAAYDDAKTPQMILDVYPTLSAPEKRDALNTLAARHSSAQILLASLKSGAIPKGDLTAPTIRNLSTLDDPDINAWIKDNWGSVRATAADKLKEIARLKPLLTAEALVRANPGKGRALFAKTCQQCHTLFDTGANIGPNLTGSNRSNVDYLLENIVDPSAVIGKDYLLTTIKTTDGRVIDGIIKWQTDNSLTIATTTELLTLPRSEIKQTKVSNVSMMPEGLLSGLPDNDVRNLIAYLGGAKQVPAISEVPQLNPAKAKVLFDGTTLAGWESNSPELWKVQDGCLTGGDGVKNIPYNDFLCTTASYSNFVLHLKIKLTGDPKTGFINSGVQIRTHRNPTGHEVCGYQCDYGEPDWYAGIYDEGRRDRLLIKSDIAALRPVLNLWGWNDYVIRAEGPHIQTWLNGVGGVDYVEPDPNVASDGIIGIQVHGGGNTLVQVKDVSIEELPPTPKAPTWESLGGVEGQKAKLMKPADNSAVKAAAAAAAPVLHTFKKLQLSKYFWSEGASFGDFNRDGKMDIVSGPYWYEGPDFTTRHEYYPATTTFTHKKADGTDETIPGFEGALGEKNVYSDNFFAFVYDFNGDGWPDILIIGFPGESASWFENPQGKDGFWKRHQILDHVDNESPTFTDIDGDGKPEIVCNSGGYFGYAKADWSDPAKPWTFHPISPKGFWGKFTHGLGVGDINGDGKMDIIEASGWWEQPASLEGDPMWKHHPFNFGGGAQFYAYDVNGDGLMDVIGSKAAHGYGLAWWEQVRTGGEITFREHLIMNKNPEENRYGVHFSELHALELADIDGDGLKDIIVGKRFWAHGSEGDPEANAPAVIYWFQLVRHGKDVDFVPHLIDDDSGVGTQVVVGDVNGDGLPDIIVGNKKGTFVHIHEKKTLTQEEWEKAQPQVNPGYIEK